VSSVRRILVDRRAARESEHRSEHF
jgi:hypothetical protein